MPKSGDKPFKVSKAPPPIKPLAGASRPRTATNRGASPDWTFWQQMLHTELWKAVALACDLNPREGPFLEYWSERERWGGNGDDALFKDYLDRLEIATANYLVSTTEYGMNASVKLAEFASWAIRMKWKPFPEAFAAMATTNAVDATSTKSLSQKPLQTRERNNLLVLIASLAKAANFDLMKPSKAASIIAKASEELGSPLPARTIEEHLSRIPQALERRAR